MNKIRKTRWLKLALCLLLSCYCCCACWDQRPIEEMGLIAAIGLDTYPANSNLLDFTFTYTVFSEDKRQEVKFDTLAANNLGEAAALWGQRNALHFAPGKVRVVLFGEEAAQRGLLGLFDYLQLPLADDNAFVAVTRGRSDEVLRAEVPETQRTPLHIQSMLRTAFRDGYAIRSTIADLATKVVVPGIDPILPILELQGENRIALVGAALFADNIMVSTLSQEELQLFLALQGKVPVVTLIPIVGESAELSKPAVEIEVLKPKVRIKPKLVYGQLQVDMELKADYVLRSYSSMVDLRKQETIEAVTRDIEASLYLEIQQLLAKFQGLQVDPLGVGKRLRATNHQQFDPAGFRQQWANAVIDVQVKLQTFRVGVVHPTK